MNAIRKIKYTVSIILLSFLVASCGTSGSGVGNNNADGVITMTSSNGEERSYIYVSRSSLELSSSLVFPEELSLRTTQAMDRCLRDVQERQEVEVMSEFSKAAPKMKSWQEVHNAAKECITKTTGTFGAFYVQQMIATTMLNTYFMMHKPTLEVQQAVGYYMDILTQHKNYLDPNLKATVLPMLIGYWSPEKIASVAQKNFEKTTNNYKAKEVWLQEFYANRSMELTKQFSEQYAQMNTQQKETKIQEDLLIRMNSFPKRTKPYPDPITNPAEYAEYEQLKSHYKPESIAILALLAQGKFVPLVNK